MFEAENNDDVEVYGKWLGVMRKGDKKMHEYAAYCEARDLLEARIRSGELVIDGFNMIYDRDTIGSIMDHLTLRANTE